MAAAAKRRNEVIAVEEFDRPALPIIARRIRFDASQEERDDQAEKAKRISLTDWSKRIPTAKGWALDFDRFPFQRELYEVFGNSEVIDADVQKAIQLGLSELLTRLTMYFADIHGLTTLHVFPASGQMYDYSTTRVNPLRESSVYLQGRTQLGHAVDWPWNKGLKRFGSGYCYYRGSESRRDLIAVDADVVALDEYDDLAPINIPEAEGRVSGSLVGLIRRVGVPTDPEHGIARRYTLSDKRVWMVACGKCGEWQSISFFTNVDAKKEQIVCQHCRKWLNVAEGEWVAEFPDRERPGFHVHRLMVPGDNALSRRRIREMVEHSKKKEPIAINKFWRNDLGLPHADAVGGLDRTAIAHAISQAEVYFGHPLMQVPGYNGTNLVTAGIDVASRRNLNVRISEHLDPLTTPGHRKRALFIGEVENFDALVKVLNRYNVMFACIDHLPDGRLAYGLANRYPGRVYVLHYSSQQKEAMVIDTDNMRVSVQRVPALDATIEIMRAVRNFLPEDLPEDYADHMVANRRKVETDDKGRQVVYYDNSSHPDDFFQAEVYDVMAGEIAKIRIPAQHLEEQEGELTTLDEHLEFERSSLGNYDVNDYSAGPGSDYSAGPAE